MPKITVHEGVSYDPYQYPELQPTTETKIVETDIKEVADQDEDTKYVKPEEEKKEDEDSSVGNSSLTSEKNSTRTTKRNENVSSQSAPTAVASFKRTP